LGLATVYGIVSQWGGFLGFESTLGMGTTFSIYFPAVQETARDAAKSEPLSSKGFKGAETILFAEDEESVRKIVARTMKNYGYHVLQAGNGVEAIQQASDYQDTIHL